LAEWLLGGDVSWYHYGLVAWGRVMRRCSAEIDFNSVATSIAGYTVLPLLLFWYYKNCCTSLAMPVYNVHIPVCYVQCYICSRCTVSLCATVFPVLCLSLHCPYWAFPSVLSVLYPSSICPVLCCIWNVSLSDVSLLCYIPLYYVLYLWCLCDNGSLCAVSLISIVSPVLCLSCDLSLLSCVSCAASPVICVSCAMCLVCYVSFFCVSLVLLLLCCVSPMLCLSCCVSLLCCVSHALCLFCAVSLLCCVSPVLYPPELCAVPCFICAVGMTV
jgi:hypothetical protein